MRLSITVFGRPVLDVELARPQPGPPGRNTTAIPDPQPEGEAPGPITEHRGGADTQLGFTGSAPRWSATRPLGGDGGQP